ncbi:hypothetical protein M758_3G148300 [Ceratodon purpureus]|nr:hypothetical protein M758_3G148300 [Ceratodon purpureus]
MSCCAPQLPFALSSALVHGFARDDIQSKALAERNSTRVTPSPPHPPSRYPTAPAPPLGAPSSLCSPLAKSFQIHAPIHLQLIFSVFNLDDEWMQMFKEIIYMEVF